MLSAMAVTPSPASSAKPAQGADRPQAFRDRNDHGSWGRRSARPVRALHSDAINEPLTTALSAAMTSRTPPSRPRASAQRRAPRGVCRRCARPVLASVAEYDFTRVCHRSRGRSVLRWPILARKSTGWRCFGPEGAQSRRRRLRRHGLPLSAFRAHRLGGIRDRWFFWR